MKNWGEISGPRRDTEPGGGVLVYVSGRSPVGGVVVPVPGLPVGGVVVSSRGEPVPVGVPERGVRGVGEPVVGS